MPGHCSFLMQLTVVTVRYQQLTVWRRTFAKNSTEVYDHLANETEILLFDIIPEIVSCIGEHANPAVCLLFYSPCRTGCIAVCLLTRVSEIVIPGHTVDTYNVAQPDATSGVTKYFDPPK